MGKCSGSVDFQLRTAFLDRVLAVLLKYPYIWSFGVAENSCGGVILPTQFVPTQFDFSRLTVRANSDHLFLCQANNMCKIWCWFGHCGLTVHFFPLTIFHTRFSLMQSSFFENILGNSAFFTCHFSQVDFSKTAKTRSRKAVQSWTLTDPVQSSSAHLLYIIAFRDYICLCVFL